MRVLFPPPDKRTVPLDGTPSMPQAMEWGVRSEE